jgi:hypothetical protein
MIAQNRLGEPGDDQNERCQPKRYADLPFVHFLPPRSGPGMLAGLRFSLYNRAALSKGRLAHRAPMPQLYRGSAS